MFRVLLLLKFLFPVRGYEKRKEKREKRREKREKRKKECKVRGYEEFDICGFMR